jgi:hypothetical protein
MLGSSWTFLRWLVTMTFHLDIERLANFNSLSAKGILPHVNLKACGFLAKNLAKFHLVATSGILEFRTPLDSARREQSIDVRFMRGTEIESVQKPFASFTKFGDFDCNAIYRLV